ncbi:MoxR family ATPase [Colwellia sp. 1_MG-2023]|uniref:AAA family ATPase n=1 Tax=Colwellia sp. 1_MG-2023 TaxID=3062649 RepID=UPI0026E3B85E|nr:MoxR family ATPase [Colwellia sp. 1_MG-2023]MDO6447291.1 MoxR family ATPase [Colwellia sp. 1_MG-2023]
MQQMIERALTQIERYVIGKPEQVKLALACLLAKGHLLIEDLPGMGKTTLAHVLASSLGLSYQRVQFTSDLLPADVIGVSIFDSEKHSFTLHKGPVFNQVVLADEINRASPKTQSALLEAMEENRVSIDGTTHSLPTPFFVIATQNPLFHAGTYPLPESQLDRFMMRISLGFPDKNAEKQILKSSNQTLNYADIKPAISLEQLQKIQRHINDIYVSDAIFEYIIALFQQTRSGQLSVNPLSPRAGKALVAAAKAWAFIDNRDHVLPDDIKSVFTSVCEHRMVGRTSQGNESLSKQVLSMVDSEQSNYTEN